MPTKAASEAAGNSGEGEIEFPDDKTQVKASKALAPIKPMRAAIQKQIAELGWFPQKLLAQIFES